MVQSHYGALSGVVHGGKEVLAIYTMHDTWGEITIDWDDLIHHVENIMVFVQLALGVAMVLSPLEPVVRLAKNSAQVLTLFTLSNLWMARRQLLPATGAVRL